MREGEIVPMSMASMRGGAAHEGEGVPMSKDSTTPMLQIMNLKKSFGDNHVLRGIDFSLKPGEKVAVIGPSGSGKSTFLRCLNRMEEPTSGEIYFDSKLVTDENIRKVLEKISVREA